MINPIQAPLHIIGTAGDYNLAQPQDYIYGYTKLFTYQEDGDVKINGTFFTRFGTAAQIQLKKAQCVELFSDGTNWYVLNSENLN